MTWPLWILAGFYMLSIVLIHAQVGKPRDPITPGMAAGVSVIYIIFICLIFLGALI